VFTGFTGVFVEGVRCGRSPDRATPAWHVEPADRFDVILIAALLISVLALCLYRLQVYPAPWFDEGLNGQAARNIALHGQYGLRSSEGLVAFHPAIQTGPTVLLLVALLFRLAGVGVLQARLVVVAYSVLAVMVFYWLVREICNRRTAFLASLLLVFGFDHEFTSFVVMGRQILGENPALAFFWLGTLLWFRAWRSRSRLALVWPGLLWGLAMLTKIQFVIILAGALFVFWLLDRIWVKRLHTRQVLIPMVVGGLCVLAWYGVQALSLGFADFWRQSTALGSAGGMHWLHLAPQKVVGAISQLLGSSLILLGVPGMLYVLGSNGQNWQEGEYCQVFLVLFTAIWLGWYAFLSIGWMRYAFVPAAMSTIFTARLLGDVWDWARQRRPVLHRWLPLAPGQVAVGGVIVMLLVSGWVPLVKQIVQSPDSGLQELAQFLNGRVPTDAVIESWEWEVDLLTDHTYHHPPYEITNAFTEQVWYSTPVPTGIYDPMAARPAYLIVGSFARWTGIYSREFLERRCTLVGSFGEYTLCKVNTDEQK